MAKTDLSGKIRLGNQKVKFTNLQVNSNMILTFDYVQGQWIFNINAVNSDVLSALDNARVIQIQLLRKNLGFISNETRLNDENYTSKNYSGYTRPNFLAVASPGDGGIPEDKKARLNISSFRKNAFRDMNLTTWVNNMIKYNGYDRDGVEYKDVNLSDVSYWYSNFKFALLINNITYSLTEDNIRIQYTDGRDMDQFFIGFESKINNELIININ